MVGVKYGNSKVSVTYSRSGNRSSSSCGSNYLRQGGYVFARVCLSVCVLAR